MKKSIFFTITIIILYFIFFITPYKESQTIKDFPVPRFAKSQSIKINAEIHENFNWGIATEERGLPTSYKNAIKLKGWKKVEQIGAKTTFEKDGVKVDVILLTDFLSVHKNNGQKYQ